MKAIENKFGKQQTKPAKLGTENRRTQDVKPTTLNPKQETHCPRGPNFAFVHSLESWVLAQAKLGDLKSERFQAEPNTFSMCSVRVFHLLRATRGALLLCINCVVFGSKKFGTTKFIC